jgi:hypothetical protein
VAVVDQPESTFLLPIAGYGSRARGYFRLAGKAASLGGGAKHRPTGSPDDRSIGRQRYLCPAAGEKQRLDVVAAPFTTATLGTMRFPRMPTVRQAAVRDDGDGFVSELISTNVVVEISFVASNDDEPA